MLTSPKQPLVCVMHLQSFMYLFYMILSTSAGLNCMTKHLTMLLDLKCPVL